jgi:C_GCAxxG_C_C family probable redox protein
MPPSADQADRSAAPVRVDPATLAALAGSRAEELFRSRRYMCTEAILVAMNEVFGGGLSEQTAAALAAGFPDGMGGSGCLCGAVSGGAMALGLLLAPTHSRRDIRALSAQLHDRFRDRHKSVCCRVLTKGIRSDKQAHFAQCAGLTGEAAAMAAGMVLAACPGPWPGTRSCPVRASASGPSFNAWQAWGRSLGRYRRRLRHFFPFKLFGL